MRRCSALLVLAQIAQWTALSFAHPAVTAYPSERHLARRQDIPPPAVAPPAVAPPAITSYEWSYPAPTATATPPASNPAVIPQVTSLNVAQPASTGSPTNFAAVSTTTTVVASPTSSSSSTSSIITITALPPAKTAGRSFKRRKPDTFHPAYLTAVFVVVGAIVGSVCAFLILWIVQKRRKSRKSSQPTLQYFPPPETAEVNGSNSDVVTDPEPELHGSESHFIGVPLNEVEPEFAGHEVARKESWLKRAFTSHKRDGAPTRADSAAQAVHQAQNSRAGQEDDPFLVPAGRLSVPGRARSPLRDRDLERARSMLERPINSPQELDEDDELDNAPYETLRHKSIRRDILERLKHGSRYRKGHKRTDSDVNIDDMRVSDGVESILTAAFRSPEVSSRERSLYRQSSIGLPPPVTAKSSSGPGFRIVEEDPEAEAQTGSSNLLGWSLPWSPSPAKLPPSDTFTALPPRLQSPARRSSSRVSSLINSPASPKKRHTPRVQMTRVDSSVLPSSPPRLTSPPLEAQLFFGPPPSFGSIPNLQFSMSGDQEVKCVKEVKVPRTPEKHAHKLHTKRSPSLLPLPSSPQYHRRLAKTPPSKPRSPVKGSRESRSRPRSGALTASASERERERARSPGERVVQRHGALHRVDKILTHGWNQRNARGEDQSASPAVFVSRSEVEKGISSKQLLV